MGVVRYVGRVEFAPGIWVGLELRDPKGRHDGKNSGDVCIVSVNHVTCVPQARCRAGGTSIANPPTD